MTKRKRVMARKFEGDDCASWAIFVDGRPVLTGLTKSEVPYYRLIEEKRLAEKAES